MQMRELETQIGQQLVLTIQFDRVLITGGY